MGVFRGWLLIISLILTMFVLSIILIIGILISGETVEIANHLNLETIDVSKDFEPIFKILITGLIIGVFIVVVGKHVVELITAENPLITGGGEE